jgi:acetoin utilization protein AcuB
MEIVKWMKQPVRSVKPLDSIQHAREVMAQHRINQLPVVAGGRLVGIVSDRDLRDAFPSVLSDPSRRPVPDPESVPVESVMTQKVFTLGPHDGVMAAAALMRRERIGALPIVEGTRLVGILARSDLLEAFIRREALVESAKAAGER